MGCRWGVTEWRNRSLSPEGWLGRVQLMGSEDPPARAFRDDPTPAEMREMDRDEEKAA